MNYLRIQKEIIKNWKIDICLGSKCYKDSPVLHTHRELRRICNWEQLNCLTSTFSLLTEIGRIETAKSFMTGAEMEYSAIQWALDRCRELKIDVPKYLIDSSQEQINKKLLSNSKHNNSKGQRGLTLKEVIKENEK